MMLDENWLWKSEPVSLNGAPSLFIDPNWLSIDPNLLENAVNNDELILYHEPDALGENINKHNNNNNEFVKEEPLHDWLEEKINFADFDGLSTEITGNGNPRIQQFVNPAKVIPQPRSQHPTESSAWPVVQPSHVENTEHIDLLEEFESLLNSGKPYNDIQVSEITSDFPIRNISQEELYSLFNQDPSAVVVNKSETEEINSPLTNDSHTTETSEENLTNTLSIDQPTESNESQGTQCEVDQIKEILKSEPEDNEEDFEVICVKEDEESLLSSSSESNMSECADSVETETSNDDPDWSVGYTKKTTRRKYTRSHPHNRKPYVRVAPEEKKNRKKEQNKNAATKYRQKKKQEIIEIVNEEQQLLDKNKVLKEKVTDIEREIKYLKNLLRDLYTAKGLIK